MFIGCSGWSHEDWVGRFYPISLARKKEEWLRYYASFFNTVEVSSTFYRSPGEIMIKGLINRGNSLKDFEYSLIIPKEISHEAMVAMDSNSASNKIMAFEESCIKPLADNELLGTVVLQLSSGFKFSDETLNALEHVLASIDPKKYRYAVEFRNNSWLNGKASLDSSVHKLLSSYEVATVQSDGTNLQPVQDVTASHTYIRLHGRECALSDEEDNEAGPGYLYSEDELISWTNLIERRREENQVRVYFTNNGWARSPKNAFQMMDILSIPHREKKIHVHDQIMEGTFMMHKR